MSPQYNFKIHQNSNVLTWNVNLEGVVYINTGTKKKNVKLYLNLEGPTCVYLLSIVQ